MKKVFEIYIDDDAEFSGFCGTVISKKPNDETRDGMGVTTFNFNKESLAGSDGYYYPTKGEGNFIVKHPELKRQEELEESGFCPWCGPLVREGINEIEECASRLDTGSFGETEASLWLEEETDCIGVRGDIHCDVSLKNFANNYIPIMTFKVKYCPHCGKDIKEYLKKARREEKEL